MLTTNACVATCPIKFVTYKCNGKCNWCHYIVLHVEGPRVKCIDLLKALNSSVVIYHQSLSYLIIFRTPARSLPGLFSNLLMLLGFE